MNLIAHALDLGLRAFEAWPTSPAPWRLVARLMGSASGSFFSPARVRALQWIRLRRIVRYAYDHSPFYRESFEALRLRPSDLRRQADCTQIPFTSAHDLRDWQQFLAVSEDRLSAVFTTSGTTGEPKRMYYTARELNALSNVGSLGLRLRIPGRLVALLALPPGLWMGTGEAQRVVERAGGFGLPVGAPDPALVVTHVRRFAPNVVITSPSFMVALTREAERQNFRIKLEAILVGGETLTRQHVERFRDFWDAPTYNSYGSTEIGGGQTMALPTCECLHLNGLQLFTEIIDPDTGLPADEGELVFTPTVREAMPLLRYRSGDLARWSHCNCWLPFGSIILAGRADDMIVAGDMNFFGHVLGEAAGRAKGATGRLAISVDKIDLTDRLRLRVEGGGVSVAEVRANLFAAYPELPHNLSIGNIRLDIETDAWLNDQFKAVRIVDRRESV